MALRAFAILAALAFAVAAFPQVGPFVIRSVDFQVKGRTLPFVLMQKLEADGRVIGKTFDYEALLRAFIEDARQLLLNNRVLSTVIASYELKDGASGGFDAELRFAVVDTWNIFVLPKPSGNSNKGLSLVLKGKDYNFVGSMQPLTLDFGYLSDTSGHQSIVIGTSFSLPFRAWGSSWNLGFDESFQAWDASTVLSKSSASLTYDIPGLAFPAYITATQGLNFNADLEYPGSPETDPWFLSESLSCGASFKVGRPLPGLGLVDYGPSLSLAGNWWPTASMKARGRAGLSLSFGNALSAGRIDWIGNMRQGASLLLKGTTSYDLHDCDLIQDLNLTAVLVSQVHQRIGLSGRAVAFGRALGDFPEDTVSGLGSYLRGIVDARISGVAGAFVNISVPLRLFVFPTHLVIKKDWLDFELQAQPFIDAAWVLPSWSSHPGAGQLWAAGGLELIFFPLGGRSFYFRANIGWDLDSIVKNRSLAAPSPRDGASPWEYWFGTGLEY